MVYCVAFFLVCVSWTSFTTSQQLTRALWVDKKKDHKASNAESQTLPGEVQLTEGAKDEAKKKDTRRTRAWSYLNYILNQTQVDLWRH